MSWETYLIFLVTTAVVCLTPGPAALLVVAQGISNGFRRSWWAIAGIALANAVYFALSATGVAALIVASGTLFSIIKWVGVAYLFYLGISAIRSKASALTVTSDPGEAVSGLPWLAALLSPDRWLLWLGLLFVLSVYYFPTGVVGRLRARRAAAPARAPSLPAAPPAPAHPQKRVQGDYVEKVENG